MARNPEVLVGATRPAAPRVRITSGSTPCRSHIIVIGLACGYGSGLNNRIHCTENRTDGADGADARREKEHHSNGESRILALLWYFFSPHVVLKYGARLSPSLFSP